MCSLTGCIADVAQETAGDEAIGIAEQSIDLPSPYGTQPVMVFVDDDWGGVGVITSAFDAADWNDPNCRFEAELDYRVGFATETYDATLGGPAPTSQGIERNPVGAVPAGVLQGLTTSNFPYHAIKFYYDPIPDGNSNRPLCASDHVLDIGSKWRKWWRCAVVIA